MDRFEVGDDAERPAVSVASEQAVVSVSDGRDQPCAHFDLRAGAPAPLAVAPKKPFALIRQRHVLANIDRALDHAHDAAELTLARRIIRPRMVSKEPPDERTTPYARSSVPLRGDQDQRHQLAKAEPSAGSPDSEQTAAGEVGDARRAEHVATVCTARAMITQSIYQGVDRNRCRRRNNSA